MYQRKLRKRQPVAWYLKLAKSFPQKSLHWIKAQQKAASLSASGLAFTREVNC
jgi:hypothetical protein